MNKIFILLLTCFYLTAQDDFSIKETLNNYLDGGTYGDTAKLRKAFHPGALQRYVAKDNKLTDTPVARFIAGAKVGQKLERTTKITSYTYIGNAATAVVESVYDSFKYVDMLNLLKFGNDWKIVSRVFTRAELNQNIQGSAPSSTNSSIPVSAATSKTGTTPAKKTVKPAKTSDDGW